MSEETSQSDQLQLQTQLRRLEKRTRWLSAGLCGILLCVVCAVAMATAMPNGFHEIRSKRYVLVDDRQIPVAILAHHNGESFLMMFDDRGTSRVKVGVGEAGDPSVILADRDGQVKVRLGEHEGEALVEVYGADEDAGKMTLGSHENGTALQFINGTGKPGIQLLQQQESSQLALHGPEGTGFLQLFALQEKLGFSLNDPEGSPRSILAMTENNKPIFMLNSEGKQTVIQAGGQQLPALPQQQMRMVPQMQMVPQATQQTYPQPNGNPIRQPVYQQQQQVPIQQPVYQQSPTQFVPQQQAPAAQVPMR